MTQANIARAIRLCGTAGADPPRRRLRAGSLSAVFQDGMVRHVRVGEVEVLRAIAFLVRDENWRTLVPTIEDLRIEERGDGFTVGYRAICADKTRRLTYDARIEASASGSLSFSATATPDTDILTNRTGFIVLHPASVAGSAVSVEHVDSRREEAKFPELISPGQPIYLIRAVTHTAGPGVRVRCEMGPDAFEMEDQRNWGDASFKTYVRPKAMPAPYVLRKGEAFFQSVTLTIDRVPAGAATSSVSGVHVDIGGIAGGVMPTIGVGVPEAEAEHARGVADLITALGPGLLVCGIDLRNAASAGRVATYRKLGEATGARIAIEAIIPGGPDPAAELAPLATAIRSAGLKPESVSVFPAPDLISVEPNGNRPAVPPVETIVRAARAAFPGVTIGGGMYSYFTELNRKRPPQGVFDFITHTTCPIVHMADDNSVMETMETLPHIIRSARAFIGDTQYRIGPSSIGCRQNPFGAGPTPNPDDTRVCMAMNDPRQRGLFAAAWAIGYAAACAQHGIDMVSLAATTGPLGVIYRKTESAQPGYDGSPAAQVYPIYHAVAGLAAGAGMPRVETKVSDPATVAAVGWRDGNRIIVWLANLTSEKQSIDLSGRPASRASVLDAAAFDRMIASVKAADDLEQLLASKALNLDAYAVARLTFPD